MENVTINKLRNALNNGEVPIKLHNGALVLWYNHRNKVLGAFLVTSYRGTTKDGVGTSLYCSFVNLDNGYLQFDERCSRSTTVARVLSHLNPNDFKAENALKEGQYLEVYNVGDYSIDLTLITKQFKQ